MYISRIPNRKSRPAVLLRETYRKGGKVKNRTLANLSSLPDEQIELIRLVLKGEPLRTIKEFEILKSLHHGHVEAIHIAMKQLKFANLIATRPSRERDIVLAMIAARIAQPTSKLAATRSWHTTTLPEIFSVANANEADLYAAMDWLLTQQNKIEQKMAKRHLKNDGQILYDLSSSYFEGSKCPLAAYGYNRDGKSGKLQVNYGLITDARGCPVSISVFEGNTSDPQTLLPQIEKVRNRFGIKQFAIVADRGMISQTQIDALKNIGGIDQSAGSRLANSWITALRSQNIRQLVEDKSVQMSLFDERNLFELSHPDYPGERLIACRNPDLGRLRAHKRQSLLSATTAELQKICDMTERGTLKGSDTIGVRTGRVINKYKMAKHFTLRISDDSFKFSIDDSSVANEAALDGIYIIRTSIPTENLSAGDAVLAYKQLSQVERAFRSMKTIDLKVRPIYHHLADRVRAHIFLCMLAYYVEWHMREALRPLLFADENQEAKKNRDPVSAARRSPEAAKKVHSKVIADGTTATHSVQTLMQSQSTIVKNLCRIPQTTHETQPFWVTTTPTAEQQRVFDLLRSIAV